MGRAPLHRTIHTPGSPTAVTGPSLTRIITGLGKAELEPTCATGLGKVRMGDPGPDPAGRTLRIGRIRDPPAPAARTRRDPIGTCSMGNGGRVTVKDVIGGEGATGGRDLAARRASDRWSSGVSRAATSPK